MRINIIGGGPGGLYAAILIRKRFPHAALRVFERNRADDTFGFGVVFSDETLTHFETADPESFDVIRSSFVSWTDIETYVHGTKTTSTGHGFSALSRKRLLNILQERARSLAIEISFQSDIDDVASLADADLVIAADGANSRFRDLHAASFRPSVDWRKCRFSWLGTTKRLAAFTFIFEETPHGLFQVHAYPFENGQATFIVECREEVWRAAGLDNTTESESAAFCERLFARHLDGHALLTNRSLWRKFPTVRCEAWTHGNLVLIGDAAHTAHFSIGSGTKLAMEDAIVLADSLKDADGRVAEALSNYEERRRLDVLKLQRAAETSLEWFENSARYLPQSPLQFTFNLMTRSKRITYGNLRLRDPKLVGDAAAEFQRAATPGVTLATVPSSQPVPPAFLPFQSRGLRLDNRIVVSPMCQYSAIDGVPGDWHLVHLGSRAIGGAGCVITEMTDVSADGRITRGCTGLYDDAQEAAWERIVRFVHENSKAKIGIQLAHAGRKGSVEHPWEGPDTPLVLGGWTTLAPSAIPYDPSWPSPKSMEAADFASVRESFAASTVRAARAGFDLIEIHAAHGYLLSSFISPLSNHRTDAYGGSLENRMRFPLEVFAAMRRVWPAEKPIWIRISATDWVDQDGLTPDDAVEVARQFKEAGADLIDVSTGGTSLEGRPIYGRMYQVPFAEKVRAEAGIPVMAVGGIANVDHANTIILAGRADLCAIARAHLHDPYLALHAAHALDHPGISWPPQYLLGRRPPAS